MKFTHGAEVRHVDSQTKLHVEFVDGMKVTCSEFCNVGVYQTITLGEKNLHEIAKTAVKPRNKVEIATQFEPGQQVAHILDPNSPMRVEYQHQHANAQHSVVVCSAVRGTHFVTFEFDQRSLIKYEEADPYGYPKSI